MKVDFVDHPDTALVVMRLWFSGPALNEFLLTPHQERDIAAALAQRHAMAKVCLRETGEHTCSERPDHTGDHKCRACTYQWQQHGPG